MSASVLLEGVDPTVFNFVSGLVGVVLQALLLYVIRKAYVVVSDLQVKDDKGLQDRIPPNFFSAFFNLLKDYALGWPIVALLVLLACADFSDSLARLGMEFVATSVEGGEDTVMMLDYKGSKNTCFSSVLCAAGFLNGLGSVHKTNRKKMKRRC